MTTLDPHAVPQGGPEPEGFLRNGLGRTVWVIAEGYIPDGSSGPEPAMPRRGNAGHDAPTGGQWSWVTETDEARRSDAQDHAQRQAEAGRTAEHRATFR